MSEETKDTAAEGGEAKAPKKNKRTIWLIVAAVIVVLLVAGGIAGWKWHEKPSFCSAICHNMDSYVDGYYNSNFLVRIHAEADVICLDCHEPKISEQVNEVIKYVTGDYKTPLAQRNFGSAMCLKCHVSMEELAKITGDLDRNPHEDPHQDDKCSTCHKSHAAQVDYCSKCHSNGGQKMVTYPWTGRGGTVKE